jgi:hypothetical protein
MRTLRFNAVILLGIFIGIGSVPLSARDIVNKEFHEEYDANDQTKLKLDNKYGNIDIRDWDRQQVMIDVIVIVDHSNKDKAQKLLDLVSIKFTKSGNEIIVETVLDSKFSRSNQGNGNDFEINYTVQMPKDVNLDLSNKYGHVFISELTGEALIDVKYGKLTVNKLSRGNIKPFHTVNLAYSTGSSISECNWLKTNIKYSKLTIDKAKAIVAYSAYSKLYVDEASSIVVDGKYDNYEFGNLDNLVINTAYSGIEVIELNDKLELLSRYTGVKIESMPVSFESVNIESKYGSVRIGINELASYKLEGEAGYSKIYYHDTGKVSKIQENNSMKVSGIVGTDNNPSATVSVITKYGNVKLDY